MKTLRAKQLIAVGVTLLDILVAADCGPLLWNYWGSRAWPRIGLLIVTGGLAFTLMDIWAKTLHASRNSGRRQGNQKSAPFLSPSENMEGADV